MNTKYDFIIVGAGLYGATFARIATNKGKKCLVIDKRNHLAGNVYTESIEDINVHKYGAHIFHTSNKKVWDFMNTFAEFNRYTNSPVANYNGHLYNLPFNMNTFYQLWKVTTPAEAQAKIEEQRKKYTVKNPKNLEEQAISLVGPDIYEKLIKGYTEKQWGRKACDLPTYIIRRLPVRFTFDNNYFNDTYQGIPTGGYTKLVEKMLNGIDVKLNTDYFEHRKTLHEQAETIVYTGQIDEFYDYKFGYLEYRSLDFQHEILNIANYQGNAVVNYTDAETPYTRIIEHKHFEFGQQPKTVITREYPKEWKPGDEPYYPVTDEKNNTLYEQYEKLANAESKVLFGGRLAKYKYYDMHNVIEQALSDAENVLT